MIYTVHLLPLCKHNKVLIHTRGKAVCPVCGSFWDLKSLEKSTVYNYNYAELRCHYNPDIGKNKIKTLEMWLDKANIEVAGNNVCEVGFGSGYCLLFLKNKAKYVYGIEINRDNVKNAIHLGIEERYLYLSDCLPRSLDNKIDLWIFQDSFEHITNPDNFLEWLVHNSSKHCKILLIAPDGGSSSQKIMGSWWIHRLEDHKFHWSKKGLKEIFCRHGFKVVYTFYPSKYISLKTVVSHLNAKKFDLIGGIVEVFEKYLHNVSIRFNIGEMGVVFQRI